jgi:cell division protein FtsL
MFRKKKTRKEFISPNQEMREMPKISARDFLGGGIFSKIMVVRQIPFILFITGLLLFYIANQYRGERIMRDIMGLEKSVRDLRALASSTHFELQEISARSKVLQLISEAGLDLEEAHKPPFKIDFSE